MKGTKGAKYLHLCMENERLKEIQNYLVTNHSFEYPIFGRKPYIDARYQHPDSYFILPHDYNFIKQLIL